MKETGNVRGIAKMWKKIWMAAVLLMVLTLIPTQSASAATPKYPSKIRLNKTSVTALIGDSFALKATISPTKVKYPTVTWTSSNPKVATVSSKGTVRIKGNGTAKITAQTANKKKAVCTVKGITYTIANRKVTVGTPKGRRVYRAFDQTLYSNSYYNSYGCVTTAVSIASSAFGKNYSPKTIHEASASEKYSERYALKKMNASSYLYGKAAISVWTASTMLNNMGIKNTPVYQFSDETAINQITKHLKAGKPVIIKANKNVHNGIRLANGHHAIVLVAIDDKGYVTWINPKTARVNYAHARGYEKYCQLTLNDLVKYHMDSAQGNYKTAYVTGLSAAGGYILVG